MACTFASSFAMSSVGWFYIYAFFKLLPFFFVYGAGMTWKEFIKQILKEIFDLRINVNFFILI